MSALGVAFLRTGCTPEVAQIHCAMWINMPSLPNVTTCVHASKWLVAGQVQNSPLCSSHVLVCVLSAMTSLSAGVPAYISRFRPVVSLCTHRPIRRRGGALKLAQVSSISCLLRSGRMRHATSWYRGSRCVCFIMVLSKQVCAQGQRLGLAWPEIWGTLGPCAALICI